MNATNNANLGWAAFATIFHMLALFSTLFRIVYRLRTSRMWWDDYMVVLPLVMDAIYFASLWTLIKSQLNGSNQNPTGINSSWISQFILSSVIWLCRISIALTFARVFPAFHNARRSALFLSVMFFLCYLSTVFINTFSCPNGTRLTAWYQSIFLNCLQSNKAFLGGLIMTSLVFLSNCTLVLFPIITLWKVKLPRNLRRIIIFAFSGTSLSMIMMILFCIVRYDNNLDFTPNKATITNLISHLEAAISLIISNLLLTVSFLYRIFRRVHDLEGVEPSITTKTRSQVTECQESGGFARETSIGRVSVLDTDDRPLSFSITRFSQLVWSSMRISEPPSFFSENISSG